MKKKIEESASCSLKDIVYHPQTHYGTVTMTVILRDSELVVDFLF